jgi:hypothetical protein
MHGADRALDGGLEAKEKIKSLCECNRTSITRLSSL